MGPEWAADVCILLLERGPYLHDIRENDSVTYKNRRIVTEIKAL
jgi:hypothetical protein